MLRDTIAEVLYTKIINARRQEDIGRSGYVVVSPQTRDQLRAEMFLGDNVLTFDPLGPPTGNLWFFGRFEVLTDENLASGRFRVAMIV